MIRKPRGLTIVSFLFIFLVVYYYVLSPVFTNRINQVPEVLFSLSLFSFLSWTDIILSSIGIIAVTYGFSHRKNWARLYIIIYLLFTSFWALMSMFVMQWQIIEHYLYLILYLFIICYLLLSDTKAYFTLNTPKPVSYHIPETYYQYQDYVLHKRNIKEPLGKIRNYYFFHKGFSPKGIPCELPKEYLVRFNEKTQVPYLKKEHEKL